MSLFDELKEYGKKDILPMHMPGHKRQSIDSALPYAHDITEIEGFDNLHDRRGILKELSDNLAKAKNAPYAFPLVGGSTAGISASVYAMTKPGDSVIISRGCHKSVYRACEIRNLRVSYIYPETSPEGFFLSVTPGELEECLSRNPGTKLVIITSPTYEGIISDINKLSEISHSHGAKLFVDAAHGAHLGYSEFFPEDAISLGADVSVESLHKTLPSLTQTSALYLNEGMDPPAFENALDIFETSSPSYVLMASIDRCLEYISEKERFSQYSELLDSFRSSVKALEKMKVIDFGECGGVFDSDRGKIVISTLLCDKSAVEIAGILRSDYNIEVEMAGAEHIICMTSICDKRESFDRLAAALESIDSRIGKAGEVKTFPPFPLPVKELNPGDASSSETVCSRLEESAGKISAQYLWAYPPGIPVLVPGEIITNEVIQYVDSLKSKGLEPHIPGENSADCIKIIK